ncbi:MAG: GNAT family N-acetyltransferase [Halodesulfurarchaeum sp.]
MDFDITSGESADIETVLEYWIALVEGQREFGSHIEAEPNRTVARDLLGQYIAGDMLAVARKGEADPGEGLLGFVMFYREKGVYKQHLTRGVIENIYVDPAVRGEGIGSALLSYAESELEARDVDVVGLSAMTQNQSAIDWYQEQGYEPHRLVLERELDPSERTGEGVNGLTE